MLDRLNPLLEEGGVLLVNECGLVDGQPRIITPHPDFRVFMAMDPQFGEVSRAMRNRCVEIVITEVSTPFIDRNVREPPSWEYEHKEIEISRLLIPLTRHGTSEAHYVLRHNLKKHPVIVSS